MNPVGLKHDGLYGGYSTGTTVKHVLFRYDDYIIYIYSNGIVIVGLLQECMYETYVWGVTQYICWIHLKLKNVHARAKRANFSVKLRKVANCSVINMEQINKQIAEKPNGGSC